MTDWWFRFVRWRIRRLLKRVDWWERLVRPRKYRPVPPYRGRWPDRDLCGND